MMYLQKQKNYIQPQLLLFSFYYATSNFSWKYDKTKYIYKKKKKKNFFFQNKKKKLKKSIICKLFLISCSDDFKQKKKMILNEKEEKIYIYINIYQKKKQIFHQTTISIIFSFHFEIAGITQQ
eukprot:TRINITY_DN66_c0_g2_i9.p2 TRINITY_DN66_c0_g2~~TRINITY_DN66_c0_g2_i9.p2  ORF type:complete len:123 (-),score=32.70 TRINITY_DN66_c0_g2_i9:34-402(-)